MSEAKVFRWDHREQPDWDEIGAAVADLSADRVHIGVHDTQSDEYEIVVYRTDAE
jgi:hypothetical protein